MSTNDKVTCPGVSKITDVSSEETNKVSNDEICEKKEKKSDRKVCFPEDHLVTEYFEPANPWLDVPFTTRTQLSAEYLESCRRHSTEPIASVLQQLKELPENTIGGGVRASRLLLTECSLMGTTPVDALEAVLKKVQFRRIEIDHADVDDEGAEALFDMLEYYESATAVSITGPRQFGIRGWQSASRMIKNSIELIELEVCEGFMEPSHASALSRSLKLLVCRLRTLCLQRASLSGEPLMCLMKGLQTNNSVRELRLGDNGLLPFDAYHIAKLLKYNSRIQLLDLSNNAIQDAGVGHLSDAIFEEAASSPPSEPLDYHVSGHESRGLAFLVLWNNHLTKDCYISLAKILQSPFLRVLNVGRNSLGCETVRLLQVDKTAGSLVSLGLQAVRLGADGSKALAELIRVDNKLQRLDLRDNKLGVAGLQAILAAMRDNVTLTQIDLDDPVEPRESIPSQSSTDSISTARLVRDIRALCRRNEPTSAPPDRLLRKISLTCHAPHVALTTHTLKSVHPEEERRGRLRSPAPSPAPSPAGSPTPHGNSRFSVTRVTPDRDSSDSSTPSTPTRPTYCTPSASRFKVVQVAEPQIQVPPSSKKSGSRFSVTRNYDSMYNPSSHAKEKELNTKRTEKVDDTTCDTTKSKGVEVGTDFNVGKIEVDKEKQKNIERQDVSNILNPKIIIRSEYDDEIEDLHENLIVLDDVPNTKGTREKNKVTTVIPKENVFKDSMYVNVPESNASIKQYTEEMIVKECEIDPKMIIDFSIASENISKTKLANETVISACAKTDSIISDVILQTEPLVELEIRPDITVDLNQVKSFDQKDKILMPVNINYENTVNSKVIGDLKNVSCDTSSVKTKLSDNKISDNSNSTTVPSDVLNLTEDDDRYSDKKEELSHNEIVNILGDDKKVKTETKLVKSSVLASGNEIVETEVAVTVKSDINSLKAKVHADQIVSNENINRDVDKEQKVDVAMKQIEAITEDLGNLIQQMQDLSTKTRKKHATEAGVDLDVNIVPGNRDNVVLKKNKSESSLDSPDLEVSRLMRKPISAFCDSSSSLEISGSSVESLNMLESRTQKTVKQSEMRGTILSTESSMESTSDVTPVNLNMSVSSNESVSPIIFGSTKKVLGSLSSLEASVSSLDSARQEKVMVTSADSGIEYSLQHPIEVKEESSSNEGTLTYSSSSKDPVKKEDQDTLTIPKRTSSLLDVPAYKSKGLDRVRKISWVAPSASFNILKPEEKIDTKPQSNLEKLLSLFQHPSSLFSRSNSDDERKSTSSTPPRKDSSLTSSFWSWGGGTDRIEKDDKDTDSLSEATDSTLSERVQVSFVDESFSKKLDSKTPSTDTDNTLSEGQTFPNLTESVKVTDSTTEKLVQNNLALSVKNVDASSVGEEPRACDNIDLNLPNDLNKNVRDVSGENNRNIDESTADETLFKLEDEKNLDLRSRSFASVLKASCSENTQEKQSVDTGQPVDKLSSKVIEGIKENISPENTLTSITSAITKEFERQSKSKLVENVVWDLNAIEKEAKVDLAPIASIDEMSDVAADDCIQLAYIDETNDECRIDKVEEKKELENVDLGKDALSYLAFEKKNPVEQTQGSLAEELREAEIKEMLDMSPELVIDDVIEIPEVFSVEITGRRNSPVIPERAKIKKANSLEDLTKLPQVLEVKSNPKAKTIAFTVPESTTPRDIPERRRKLRTRSGSSPKSLPESLNKPCPLTKMDSLISKKKKKVSSLGKIARDSLLALNMSEEEIAEFRRSYKLTSVESLRSLESVSEDANSQSGTSIDSRCRSCLRTSQESLMSLDSISEDCRCMEECEKRGHR